MANEVTTGSIQTSSVYYGTYFKVTWSRSAVSETNNTSTISWTVYLVTESASWYSNAIKINSLVINGDAVVSNQTYSNKSHGTFALASGTKTIGHNEDGTKTFSLSFSGWLIDEGTLTASGSFTLPVINRGKPTATLSVSPSNTNLVINGWGLYVKGFTKVAYTIAGTPYSGSGATISNYEFVGNGETKTTASGTTTNALTSSGPAYVKARVKDSRGVWGDYVTQNIIVYDYAAPKLTTSQAFRCSSNGTANVGGEYIFIKAVAAVGNTVNGNNAISSLTYAISDVETGTVLDSGNLTSGTAVIVPNVLLEDSYLVIITATDSVGTSTIRTVTIPVALTTFSLMEGGKGAAFSKVANVENAVDFGTWHPIGYIVGLGKATYTLASSDDFNACIAPGVYSVPSNVVAESVSNIPTKKGGVLRVWNGLGNTNVGQNTYHYVVQEFIDFQANVYYRSGSNGTTVGTYTWSSWKQVTMTTI